MLFSVDPLIAKVAGSPWELSIDAEFFGLKHMPGQVAHASSFETKLRPAEVSCSNMCRSIIATLVLSLDRGRVPPGPLGSRYTGGNMPS